MLNSNLKFNIIPKVSFQDTQGCEVGGQFLEFFQCYKTKLSKFQFFCQNFLSSSLMVGSKKKTNNKIKQTAFDKKTTFDKIKKFCEDAINIWSPVPL